MNTDANCTLDNGTHQTTMGVSGGFSVTNMKTGLQLTTDFRGAIDLHIWCMPTLPPQGRPVGPSQGHEALQVNLHTVLKGIGFGLPTGLPRALQGATVNSDLQSPWSAGFKEGLPGEPSLNLRGTGFRVHVLVPPMWVGRAVGRRWSGHEPHTNSPHTPILSQTSHPYRPVVFSAWQIHSLSALLAKLCQAAEMWTSRGMYGCCLYISSFKLRSGMPKTAHC